MHHYSKALSTLATAKELYATAVCDFSKSERLRLATLILEDIPKSVASALGYSDERTEEALPRLDGVRC